MDVQEMPETHMPGWIIEIDLGSNRGADFQLWAPKPDRTNWSAYWMTYEVNDPDEGLVVKGSDTSDYRRAGGMDEALGVFDTCPDRNLAARARQALSAAARDYDQRTGIAPVIDG